MTPDDWITERREDGALVLGGAKFEPVLDDDRDRIRMLAADPALL